MVVREPLLQQRNQAHKRSCYMSDKAAQLLDADVLRKFFADLNTVALDGNLDRKALSARCED